MRCGNDLQRRRGRYAFFERLEWNPGKSQAETFCILDLGEIAWLRFVWKLPPAPLRDGGRILQQPSVPRHQTIGEGCLPWAAVIFLLMFVTSLAAVCLVIVLLPEPHLVDERPRLLADKPPLIRW